MRLSQLGKDFPVSQPLSEDTATPISAAMILRERPRRLRQRARWKASAWRGSQKDFLLLDSLMAVRLPARKMNRLKKEARTSYPCLIRGTAKPQPETQGRSRARLGALPHLTFLVQKFAVFVRNDTMRQRIKFLLTQFIATILLFSPFVDAA